MYVECRHGQGVPGRLRTAEPPRWTPESHRPVSDNQNRWLPPGQRLTARHGLLPDLSELSGWTLLLTPRQTIRDTGLGIDPSASWHKTLPQV